MFPKSEKRDLFLGRKNHEPSYIPQALLFYWKSTNLHPLHHPAHRSHRSLYPVHSAEYRITLTSEQGSHPQIARLHWSIDHHSPDQTIKIQARKIFTDLGLIYRLQSGKREICISPTRHFTVKRKMHTPHILCHFPHEKISRHRSKRIRRFFIQRTSRLNAGITFSLTFPQKATPHRSCCTIQRATVRAASISLLNSAFDSAFSSPISPFSMKSR